MSFLMMLALPFAGSLLTALLPQKARNAASIITGLVALVDLVFVSISLPLLRSGEIIRERVTWIPDAGLDLSIRVDGFAWVFSVLILAIGLLVAIYARYYMSSRDPIARFYGFLQAFMGAMLGIAWSGNLIQLVFFWELTSLVSFLLIGYWYHRSDARQGALMALTATAAGGFAMLAGVILLGQLVGSFDLDQVLAAGDRVRDDPAYPLILVLILAGALTKSAQFPFHFWLPRAMAAPTPVSAYLHSATMVKAGIFLMTRLWPILSGTELWFWLVGGAGLVTLLLGAWLAIFQRDLKGLLAYSTISNLGLITLLLGLNSPLATIAAIFHLINHAIFKAALFMSVGIIDHETGTRDTRRLGGLFRAMPHTAVLAIVSSAAMAGVPLLNGFLSKEMFFAETTELESMPVLGFLLPACATIAGACAVVYSLRFVVDTFFGAPARDLPHEPHEPKRWMRVPMELLVLACIVVGVAPALSVDGLLRLASASVIPGPLPHYTLSIWHGFNAPLLMSIVAMVVGATAFLLLRRRSRSMTQQLENQDRARPDSKAAETCMDGGRLFRLAMLATTRFARRLLPWLDSSRLQTQIFIIFGITFAAAALATRGVELTWGDRTPVPATPQFALLWVVGGLCAVGAAWQAKFHRLAALTMLSGTGVVVCLTWAWFSAPDLALTQLAVEVITTVLFLLGLRWLPKREEDDARSRAPRVVMRRVRDLTLSIGVAAGMAAFAFAMLTRRAPQSISPYYLEQAVPMGGGTNVVNVMLVDFRGFDTMGEIVVLGIVGLTVFALLRRFRPPIEALDGLHALRARRAKQLARQGPRVRAAHGEGESSSTDTSVQVNIPAILAGIMFPLSLAVSLHLFLRGHNEPGGGFVAGLLVSIAFVTQYMVHGASFVESRVAMRPIRWIGFGLLIALLSGAGAFVFGHPFLTSHVLHFDLPVLGELHLASALGFDIGVFVLVVGSSLLILLALAHQSVRAQRKPEQDADAAGEPTRQRGRA